MKSCSRGHEEVFFSCLNDICPVCELISNMSTLTNRLRELEAELDQHKDEQMRKTNGNL